MNKKQMLQLQITLFLEIIETVKNLVNRRQRGKKIEQTRFVDHKLELTTQDKR